MIVAAYNEDLELQHLFAGEIEERAARLVDGAEHLAAGDLPRGALGDMYREGHTIKGTARMMGYSAISDAGKLLEDAWRSLREGETEPAIELALALGHLAKELLGAVSADPSTGTPGLAAGMRELRRELQGDRLAIEEMLPDGVAGANRADYGDLGGLLGTLDSWAFGENTRVNAASLFRLINEVCSLRVDAEAVVAMVGQVTRSLGKPADLEEALTRLHATVASNEKAVVDLQTRAVDLAANPLSEITSTYPQLVRYVSRKAGKEIRFELVGDQFAADRQVLERLSDPLRHLLVNAVHHGVEPPEERAASGKPRTATLALRAEVNDHRLSIVVEDDGRGVDWNAVRRAAIRRGLLPEGETADTEALRSLLFAPNFSTTVPGELVGDGQGLAAVAQAVEALHGSLVFETEPGQGTRVTITVPTSRALQDAVLITAAGQTWGIPEIAVLDHLALDSVRLIETPQRTEMTWEGTTVPVMSFADAVGLRETGVLSRVLVISSPIGPVGFMVVGELGRRQVAARELGPVLDGVPHLTGAALLGGGDVVVLVDPSRLAERARAVRDTVRPRRRVLVIDDSRGARQVVGGALGSAGFEVDLAGSPTEALSVLAEQEFDAIVMDYVLPTMDGATLAGRVRQLGITAPIVMLSGAATAEDQSRALKAGADAYLDKDDVRKGALAAVIHDLIEAA
ncbi:MAG: response regulator [Actinomycetota bacterium]